jgi:hypothetical protein
MNVIPKLIFIVVADILIMNLAIYFIGIPVLFNLDAYDTVYFQYIIVFLILCLGDYLVSKIFFDNDVIIILLDLIIFLILGIIGEIYLVIDNQSSSYSDISKILLVFKYGLIFLRDAGPVVFYVTFALISFALKYVIILRTKKNYE